MSPSLSVIVPIYNAEGFLPQLFDTLASQGLFEKEPQIPMEAILIDDGSKDKSAETIAEWTRKFHNVRYLKQINSGQAAARNRGLDEARMNYVYMMDQDDILIPDTLAAAVMTLHTAGADILRFKYTEIESSEIERIKFELMPQGDMLISPMTGMEFIKKSNYLQNETIIWTSVISRDYLNKNHLRFCESIRIVDDYLFNINMFLKDPKMVLADNIGIIYVHYKNSDSHNPDRLHIWSRSQSNILLAKQLKQIHENIESYKADAEIANWLKHEKVRHVLLYWYLVLMWMPESPSWLFKEIERQMQDDILIPDSPFPYSEDRIRPYGMVFKAAWAGMKKPSLLKALIRARKLVKSIIKK